MTAGPDDRVTSALVLGVTGSGSETETPIPKDRIQDRDRTGQDSRYRHLCSVAVATDLASGYRHLCSVAVAID
ncbi:hypothetical protein CEXT_381351 [Caerostris extrusa]|uniref:Uncharacterized protein n=1 Tax=Caerostris extrusa TaxID=172846 RepID=A0AAV4THH1_CAEEX|nr:hypothetical protein CEXT_381351 [Caerostris extrusa]